MRQKRAIYHFWPHLWLVLKFSEVFLQYFFEITYNFPVKDNAALNMFAACFCQLIQITGGVNLTIDKLKVACPKIFTFLSKYMLGDPRSGKYLSQIRIQGLRRQRIRSEIRNTAHIEHYLREIIRKINILSSVLKMFIYPQISTISWHSSFKGCYL